MRSNQGRDQGAASAGRGGDPRSQESSGSRKPRKKVFKEEEVGSNIAGESDKMRAEDGSSHVAASESLVTLVRIVQNISGK